MFKPTPQLDLTDLRNVLAQMQANTLMLSQRWAEISRLASEIKQQYPLSSTPPLTTPATEQLDEPALTNLVYLDDYRRRKNAASY